MYLPAGIDWNLYQAGIDGEPVMVNLFLSFGYEVIDFNNLYCV